MQLSGQQYALLLDEVAAMIAADRPLASGLRELDTRTLGRLGRYAGQVADRLEAGEAADAVFASLNPKTSTQITTAFKLLESTGSTRPVQAIANWMRSRAETRRLAWIAMIYPAISLAFAYFLVAVLLPWFIRESRNLELGRPALPDWLEATIFWLHENIFVVPLIVAGLLIAIWLFGWRWYRSSPIDSLSRWGLFSELMSIQVDAGVPIETAMANAFDAIGDRRLSEQSRSSGVADCEAKMPPVLRWSLSKLHLAPPRQQSFELETLARFYQERAQTRFGILMEWGPLLVSIVTLICVVALIVSVTLVPMYDHIAGFGGN